MQQQQQQQKNKSLRDLESDVLKLKKDMLRVKEYLNSGNPTLTIVVTLILLAIAAYLAWLGMT